MVIGNLDESDSYMRVLNHIILEDLNERPSLGDDPVNDFALKMNG